jgi:serine/threonine-protein kinase RsbW
MDPTPPARLHLAIEGAGVPFAEALEAFRSFLDASAVDERAHYVATLAFEELVVNVLRHAGIRPAPTEAVVDVAAVVADDAVRFEVEDRGPPFDPTAHPEPPPPDSIESAPIGGLGIQIVRRSVDRIDYARTARGNRVEVTVLRARESA